MACWPRVLRTISRPLDSGAYRNERSSPRHSPAIVAVRLFSGLTNSVCALASAAASSAMFSLLRNIGRLQQIKADRTRFGPARAQSMTDSFLSVFRDQSLEFRLG